MGINTVSQIQDSLSCVSQPIRCLQSYHDWENAKLFYTFSFDNTLPTTGAFSLGSGVDKSTITTTEPPPTSSLSGPAETVKIGNKKKKGKKKKWKLFQDRASVTVTCDEGLSNSCVEDRMFREAATCEQRLMFGCSLTEMTRQILYLVVKLDCLIKSAHLSYTMHQTSSRRTHPEEGRGKEDGVLYEFGLNPAR